MLFRAVTKDISVEVASSFLSIETLPILYNKLLSKHVFLDEDEGIYTDGTCSVYIILLL